MNKRMIFAASALLAALPGVSQAHQLRNFLDTYEYRIVDEGHRELQFHTDFRDPDRGDEYFTHQTGVEYGASGLYTVGLYAAFVEGSGFTAARLLNRYRLSEPGVWPIDTAVQLEIKDANGRRDQDKIEGMVILSHQLQQIVFTANAIMQLNREFNGNGDDEWDVDPALALAALLNNGNRATPGVELFIADDQSRIVPGVYLPIAPNIRLNLGLGIGLEDKADTFQLKTLLSAEF